MTARLAVDQVTDVDVRHGDTVTVVYYPNHGWLRFQAAAVPAAPARKRTPAHPALVGIRHSDRTWTAAQLRDLAAIHVALADWLDTQQPDGQLSIDGDVA